MKPTRLFLKGFRGIKDGMGLDSYELDLASISDARMIAIAGPNGRGKTTVLDNLHPYPILPSRSIGYSTAAFSMYEQVLPPEAVKELDWEHDGRRYRSSFVWRSGARRKSCEAYLLEAEVDDDAAEERARGPSERPARPADCTVSDRADWRPARLADGTVSDGKVDIYNRMLEEILGSPEMFFSSQFSAQGRRKLFEYREGELKQLLVELLDLGAISRLGGKAVQVLRALAAATDALRIAGVPSKDTPNIEALTAALIEAERSSVTLEATQAIERRTLLELEQTFALANGQAARRQELESSLRGTRSQKQQANEALAGQRMLRAGAIRSREEILARREEILAAPALVEALRKDVVEAEERLRAASALREAHQKAKSDLAVIEAESRNRDREVEAVKRDVAELRLRATLAGEVPCVGTELQPLCKLLAQALAALAKVPETEALLAKVMAEATELTARCREFDAQLLAAGDPARACAQLEAELAQLRARQELVTRLASQEPEVRRAEAELLALRGELAQVEADHAKADGEHQTRLEQLERELRELPESGQIRAHLDAQATTTQRIERELAAVQARVANLKAETNAARQAQQRGAAMQRRCEALRSEQAYWQLLAKALGTDGLIAMLIDEAGPTLAAIANDILLACYGRRFTVSIATQRQLANGTLAETLDVLVHDAESDEAKSLVVMSGGQKVWINEALTRAIAVYMAQVSGRRYATLFCDESDGPLDPERKRLFVQMQKKVLELGGYERMFFVTQTPELLAYADHVIEL